MFHILRCQKVLVKEWKTTAVRPFWRIYWNASPGALIQCSANEVYCDLNNIICIPPGLSVKQTIVKPFEHLWMHVDTPFLSDYKLKIHKFKVDESLKSRLEALSLCLERGEGESPLAQSLKYAVVYWFISGLQLNEPVKAREMSDLVKRAISIMDTRLQSGISADELAQLLSVSSKTLNRQFKKYMDMPPHKFLNSLRIKKATALLFSKSLTLDEISYRCGFCNRSHFSRAFRESYNQSPAAFRKDQSG